IIEMIQIASLLHDDVIDDSLTRRGVSSINAIFGNKKAIMFGDILYSKAFKEMTQFDEKIVKMVANSVVNLSIGEMMDVDLSDNFNDNEDKYFKMIYLKTASLIETCTYCAAILKGYDENKFAIYGKNLGIAFQIVDDILDITQDEKILGKPNFNDFKEGKVTLPYLKLYQKLHDNDKNYLKSLYKKELNSDELNWIKENMKKYNVVDECYEVVNMIVNEALETIKEYKNSILEEIVLKMTKRDY
ncbi:MAG: polyprenyl synthetase family protein, partial [Campylobacterales bacterium]|nr:polyprenyl synthetase family protein [Campylobacterales bacterium]